MMRDQKFPCYPNRRRGQGSAGTLRPLPAVKTLRSLPCRPVAMRKQHDVNKDSLKVVDLL